MMAASLSSHFSSLSPFRPPRSLTITPPPSPSSSSFPHRRGNTGTTAAFLTIFSGQHRLASSSVRFATGGGGGGEGSAGGGRDINTTFFDNLDPEQEYPFQPAERPEGYVPPPYFDEGPPETEDEMAAAYEEIYGPAYSGVSVLGNDVNVMDAKMKKAASGFGSKRKKEKVRDGLEERVVQVRRVTKVVKGGKQLHFRAIVVVGDKKGNVGVGVGKAKEVISAVDKSATNARRNIISVPMTKYSTFPHR